MATRKKRAAAPRRRTTQSEPTGVSVDELPAELRRRLGITKPRQSKFTVEDERRWALKILATIADVPQSARCRVLKRAVKINDV